MANERIFVGMSTPWGRADSARMLAEGIGEVGTPSHGGVWLSIERRKQLPVGFPRQTWYEEDCDWAIPFVVFAPDIVMGGEQYAVKTIMDGHHKQCLERWHPDLFELYFGVEARSMKTKFVNADGQDAMEAIAASLAT